MRKIIVIGGPTASGKTALAIRCAKKYNTGIISADSRQCYTELSIGTAKPNDTELSSAPHYFINVHHLPDKVNAGIFCEYAKPILDNLLHKNGVAIIAGGTGLYIKALLEGLDEFPDIPEKIRVTLSNEAQLEGALLLHREELKIVDPDWYNKVDLNNHRRILRALEIIRHTGKPYTSFLNSHRHDWKATVHYYYLNPERELLYERINKRVDAMIEQGLENEVRNLQKWKSHPALNTVGYQELFPFFDGKISLEEAILQIKQHSRNYAKRQWTWFRNQGEWIALNPSETDPESILNSDRL
jgi:tRNA dimethylallyltransferase